MSAPAARGWFQHSAIVGLVALSAYFGYQHLQQTTNTDIIAARSAFMFETGSTARPLARFMESQSDEITFRLPADADSTEIAEASADSLEALAAQGGIDGPGQILVPDAAITQSDGAATDAEAERPADTSTPPATAARTPDTTPAQRPALTATDTRPTPATEVPGGITWNDNDRYYFEVRITANTGAAATRNYLDWRERAGAENVTLLPEYREGRLIRWLIGTDRYQTFRLAVAAIESDRGAAAVNNAFVTLYHLTDFRIFGDTPNFDPAEPGFTLQLGAFDTQAQALQAQQQWLSAGLDQTRIATASGRYLLLTGRYNEEAEAELLALVIKQKSGQTAEVVPLSF
jgi:hypothetical protein